SSKGARVAWVHGGAIWWTTPDGKGAQAFTARGSQSRPTWSPDGARLAFTSTRGDHSFIGVYDVATDSVRYLDPATDLDSNPEWSPDSRSIAFLSTPSPGQRAVRDGKRSGEPWSLSVDAPCNGARSEIWRAQPGT